MFIEVSKVSSLTAREHLVSELVCLLPRLRTFKAHASERGCGYGQSLAALEKSDEKQHTLSPDSFETTGGHHEGHRLGPLGKTTLITRKTKVMI